MSLEVLEELLRACRDPVLGLLRMPEELMAVAPPAWPHWKHSLVMPPAVQQMGRRIQMTDRASGIQPAEQDNPVAAVHPQ